MPGVSSSSSPTLNRGAASHEFAANDGHCFWYSYLKTIQPQNRGQDFFKLNGWCIVLKSPYYIGFHHLLTVPTIFPICSIQLKKSFLSVDFVHMWDSMNTMFTTYWHTCHTIKIRSGQKIVGFFHFHKDHNRFYIPIHSMQVTFLNWSKLFPTTTCNNKSIKLKNLPYFFSLIS